MESDHYLQEVADGLRNAMIEQLKKDQVDTGFIRKLIKCHETVTQEAGIPPTGDFDDEDQGWRRPGGILPVGRVGGENDLTMKLVENVVEMFRKANPVVNEAEKLLKLVDNEHVNEDVKSVLVERANELLKDGYRKEEPCESQEPKS